MSTNGGEDSLNEHTEDLNTSEMNSLRLRLGGKESGSEPTKEQLIATGELDSEDELPDEDVDSDEKRPQGNEKRTSIIPAPEEPSSIREQVKEKLLSGVTRQELIAQGYNKSTIATVASELRTRQGTRTQIGKAPMTTSKGLPVFAKGSPPEAIIDAIDIPDVADGQGVPFEQGIKFGMSLIILGVRVAQELSGIGITQAKPILDMAKSMREGEAMAAKNAAGEAASEAAGMVFDQLAPTLRNLQAGGQPAPSSDPMKAMMMRTMEPVMQNLLSNVFGRLLPGTAPQQLTDGKNNTNQSSVQGWTRKSE